MDFTRESARTIHPHARFLGSFERIFSDCHQGFTHRLRRAVVSTN